MSVFVKISNWHKGVKFEESVEVLVFETLEKAIEELELEKEQVEKTFSEVYGEDNYVVEDHMLINSTDIYHGDDDWWSCEIIEKEVL